MAMSKVEAIRRAEAAIANVVPAGHIVRIYPYSQDYICAVYPQNYQYVAELLEALSLRDHDVIERYKRDEDLVIKEGSLEYIRMTTAGYFELLQATEDAKPEMDEVGKGAASAHEADSKLNADNVVKNEEATTTSVRKCQSEQLDINEFVEVIEIWVEMFASGAFTDAAGFVHGNTLVKRMVTSYPAIHTYLETVVSKISVKDMVIVANIGEDPTRNEFTIADALMRLVKKRVNVNEWARYYRDWQLGKESDFFENQGNEQALRRRLTPNLDTELLRESRGRRNSRRDGWYDPR